MKASRETKPSFVPVTITLESQAEVDSLYAIFNHAWVTDAPKIAAAFGDEPFEVLEQFTSDNKDEIHRELSAFIRTQAAK